MKILLQYLKPQKWMVALILLLAALNIGFSLVDPIIFGELIDLANNYYKTPSQYQPFFWGFAGPVMVLLGYSIGVAMISRVAKNFHDYFFGLNGVEY